MTDQECIKHLEFYIDHLDNEIIKLSKHAYFHLKLEESKTMYALARAALITLRAKVAEEQS